MAHPTHRHDTTHRGLVPTDQLGTGTPDSTTYLRGDQTWALTGSGLTADQMDAINGAASPSASNVFATIADITGGGGMGTFPTIVESVGWTASSGASQMLSLASNPSAGDVLIACRVAISDSFYNVSGGGVTNWFPIETGGLSTPDGVTAVMAYGVVDTTPSTDVTIVWGTHNVEQSLIVNLRGLTGKVESSKIQSWIPGGNTNARTAGTIQTKLAPICLALYWQRANVTPTLQAGFTSIASAGAPSSTGWSDLAYKDVTAGEAAFPWWTSNTSKAFTVILALLR
jgi:hypothetical protein